MEIICVLITFVIFLFLGLPAFYVLALCCLVFCVASGDYMLLFMLPSKMFEGMDRFIIMAIPLFIVTGDIMNNGGVTKFIVRFTKMLIGRIRGSLAYVNIVGSTFFAGITGSALSDISALGSILIPAMEEEGYDKEFATAVTAASALQGPLVPPSLPAVTIAAVTNVSTGALFLGTAVPGLLLGLGCMVITFVLAKKRNYPVSDVNFTFMERLIAFKDAFLPLMTPIIIMGGMLGGIFTPTEAAAVAVMYCYCISFFYKRLTIKQIFKILRGSITLSAGIYLIIAASNLFGYLLSINDIPTLLTNFLFSITDNTLILFLILNLFILIWGMFMDSGPAIMILMPLVFPVFTKMGIEPIHFCAVFAANIMVGLLTPPFGTGLFAAQGVGKCDMNKLIKELAPFIIVDICVVFIITIFPELTTTIPKLFGLIK